MLFAAWLGGSFGVFYATNLISDPDSSIEARFTALRMCVTATVVPAASMALIAPVGLSMAAVSGAIQLGMASLIVIWVFGVIWFVLALISHLSERGTTASELVNRTYEWLQLTILIVVMAVAAYALLTDSGIPSSWLALKLLVFACLIVTALGSRRYLQRAADSVATISDSASTADLEASVKRCLKRARPYIFVSWLLLIGETVLGIVAR